METAETLKKVKIINKIRLKIIRLPNLATSEACLNILSHKKVHQQEINNN
jgi:hypothetical protein